jgi:hypothetical protein
MGESNRLAEWMSATSATIAANYAENHAKAARAARVQQVGHSAEAAWKALFDEWLPPQFETATRRYILPEVATDSYDYRETDLIIFRPGYPRALRNREEVLASGVLAAFSVKLTLDTNGLRDAVAEAARIRRHTAPRLGTPRRELVLPFRFGVLAHSHRMGLDPHGKVAQTLNAEDAVHSKHPRQSLDIACIADLGVWSKSTLAYTPTIRTTGDVDPVDWQVSTSFIEHATRFSPDREDEHWPKANELDPVLVFVGALYDQLAQEDELAEPFSSGLIASGNTGSGSGWMRHWKPNEVFEQSTLARLPRRFVNGRGDRDWSMRY